MDHDVRADRRVRARGCVIAEAGLKGHRAAGCIRDRGVGRTCDSRVRHFARIAAFCRSRESDQDDCWRVASDAYCVFNGVVVGDAPCDDGMR